VTRVGLLLPAREAAIRGDRDARNLVDLARRAEASGFAFWPPPDEPTPRCSGSTTG
jgi:hypothetical protein